MISIRNPIGNEHLQMATQSLESGLRQLEYQIDDFQEEAKRKANTSRQAKKILESACLRLLGSQTDDFHKESHRK